MGYGPIRTSRHPLLPTPAARVGWGPLVGRRREVWPTPPPLFGRGRAPAGVTGGPPVFGKGAVVGLVAARAVRGLARCRPGWLPDRPGRCPGHTGPLACPVVGPGGCAWVLLLGTDLWGCVGAVALGGVVWVLRTRWPGCSALPPLLASPRIHPAVCSLLGPCIIVRNGTLHAPVRPWPRPPTWAGLLHPLDLRSWVRLPAVAGTAPTTRGAWAGRRGPVDLRSWP